MSDDYSKSVLCKWQNQCREDNKHCSFLCSLGDWLDNISDVLHDDRFDSLSVEADEDFQNQDVLFRYYTRFLLLISEVIEDFVVLNQKLRDFDPKRKDMSARDLEFGVLKERELKDISEYINSVCKHKTERENVHVHNHHLVFRFEDFDDEASDNQIRLGLLNVKPITRETTILIPKLNYFVDVLDALRNKIDKNLETDLMYKTRLHDLFVDEWID